MEHLTDYNSDTEVMIVSKFYDLEKPTKSQALAWQPSPHGIRKCLKLRSPPVYDSRKDALSDGELDGLMVNSDEFVGGHGASSRPRPDEAGDEGGSSSLSSDSAGTAATAEDTGVYEPLCVQEGGQNRVVIYDNGDDDQAQTRAKTARQMDYHDHDDEEASSDSSCCIIEEEEEKERPSPAKRPPASPKKESFLTSSSAQQQQQQSRDKKPVAGDWVFGLCDAYHNTWRLGRVIGSRCSVKKDADDADDGQEGRTYYTVQFDLTNRETDEDEDEDEDDPVSPVHLRRAQLSAYKKKKLSEDLDESDDERSLDTAFKVDRFMSQKAGGKSYERPAFSLELDETSVAYYDRPNRAVNAGQLPIGSRVVADFTLEFHELSLDPNTKRYDAADHDQDIMIKSEFKASQYFCSGTVISTPAESNSQRYLVFFDNGCIGYFKPAYLFPVVSLAEIPHARLHVDHVHFLDNYFREYPELPLVSLDEGQFVLVYSNEKWMPAKVISVDALLAHLRISIDAIETEIKKSIQAVGKRRPAAVPSAIKREDVYPDTLTLYRGSYRLYPLYERIIKSVCATEARSRLNLLASSPFSEPFSEYERFVKEKYEKLPTASSRTDKKYLSLFASSIFPKRGLRDYYAKMLAEMTAHLKTNNQHHKSGSTDMRVKQGDIRYLDLEANVSTSVVGFAEHPCSNVCVNKLEVGFGQVHAINPLLYPLLHGWQRHVSTQSRGLNIGSKKWITYMAPCGRVLRSTGEVDRYLYLTDSQLTIDMFAFDSDIHVNREFEANAKYLSIHDMTKGVEQTPISCVNCIDTSLPDEFMYSASRIAREGVPLVTDEKEMEGCDCTDNCRDRSKCACWRKTFEATVFTNKEINTKIGYRGRRLPEMLNTGIFECNSHCKCDCRCTNKVVQNGLKLRLQLYKTANKGWGLRCLDDIPKGAFICVYNGELLTEEQSDERGKMLGDEYFAELDFLDCLRRFEATNGGGGILSAWSLMVAAAAAADTGSKSKKKSNKQAGGGQAVEDAYQRPRLKLQLNKRPPAQGSGSNERDCIFLDSDEDEQDIEEFKASQYRPYSADVERDRLKCQSRQESVNSNRFFTSLSYRRTFDAFLKDESVYIMDAKLLGNIGRYFNHSCAPNLFVQNVFVDTYDLRFPWIAFFASQSIRAGTELSWDYNYTIDSVKNRKLYCYCGAANCRGRLL